jgi:NADH pyrophosphatase NudC (nudix superfamily)
MMLLNWCDRTSGNTFLQARWVEGRYSVLAGFVEIGETFEKAVAREVKEEAGIDVDVSTVR